MALLRGRKRHFFRCFFFDYFFFSAATRLIQQHISRLGILRRDLRTALSLLQGKQPRRLVLGEFALISLPSCWETRQSLTNDE